jgi:AMP deaminase
MLAGSTLYDIPSLKNYFQDLDFILATVADGPTKSFAFRRLKYLDSSFGMYVLLNESKEIQEQKVGNRKNHFILSTHFL